MKFLKIFEKNNIFSNIFNNGLYIAQYYPNDAKEYLIDYAQFLYNKKATKTLEEAIKMAKQNFLSYSKYFSNDIIKIIYKTYS